MAKEPTQKRLHLRVSRLRKLIELEAPELILKGEKDLIEKALAALEPANLVHACLNMEAGVREADKERQAYMDASMDEDWNGKPPHLRLV